MRTIIAIIGLVLFGAVVDARKKPQPRIWKWKSNPAFGCTVDCDSLTTRRTCARPGRQRKVLGSNAGCCSWNKDTQTCSDRPCSWFDEDNCNNAPHCGWSAEEQHLTPAGKPQCVPRIGCTGMYEKTCKKYFQYCRWNPTRVAADGKIGSCVDLALPTSARISADTACFGMPERSCNWWWFHGPPGMDKECLWTGDEYGCEPITTINRNCWWGSYKNFCERAISQGFECNWNKKLKRCTKYKKLQCYNLVGWEASNDMTIKEARESCCSDSEVGETVKGAIAKHKCKTPKLGAVKYNDCRWCPTHEESPRCVKAQNCPYTGAGEPAN